MSDTTVIPEWTLADRLRKAREVTGMSKEEFADAVGVSRNTVSNYENGHTRPRIIELRAWSMATGVPMEWLAPEGVKRPRQDSNLRLADYIAEPWAFNDRILTRSVAGRQGSRRRRNRRVGDTLPVTVRPVTVLADFVQSRAKSVA